jgi:hypothetical protein
MMRSGSTKAFALVGAMILSVACENASDTSLENSASAVTASDGLQVESAVRLPGEDWQMARDIARSALPSAALGTSDGPSAQDSAIPWPRLDLRLADIPSWAANPTWLEEGFEYARDPRFIVPKFYRGTPFPRRESWLYPDDGCWLRAELAAWRLGGAAFPRPGKIFAFGPLTVKTNNSPRGEVSWWFHVAPIVRGPVPHWLPMPDGSGPLLIEPVFVLDPAIDPSGPLLVQDWLLRMVTSLDEVKVAICSPFTYGPSSSCWRPTPVNEQAVIADQEFPFFGYEWLRQTLLHRDPRAVLGNDPPWAPDGGIPDGGL